MGLLVLLVLLTNWLLGLPLRGGDRWKDHLRRPFRCLVGWHGWQGQCKCQRCGLVRDANHPWQGCVCQMCGATRHQTQGACACVKCGEIVHNWVASGLPESYICQTCTGCRHLWLFTEHRGFCKCPRCGQVNPNYRTRGVGGPRGP